MNSPAHFSQPTAQRILVVDDDPDIRELICEKLDSAGYATFMAETGAQALAVIQKHGLPHLALVDLTMPGMDGFRFCEAVQQFSDLPIIIVTATSDEETVVRGIERYAEDYMTKPFSPRELVARIQRVLRRVGDSAYSPAPILHVDDGLAVDFARQEALVKGKATPLTPTETKILYILIRNAGRTISTQFLLSRLWPRQEVFEDTLRVHIHRLRHKIESVPNQPRYILTERGQGYSFPAKR